MIGKKSVSHSFHHFVHICNAEVLEISLFQLFRNVAKNLAGLMLPFFLYLELGYEIYQVAFFFFCWQFSFVFVEPFLGGIIRKIGLKHSIALRCWIGILFYMALPFLLTGDYWMDLAKMAPIFILRAVCVGSSEIAYDIFLTHHINQEKKGKTLAYIQVAIMASAFLAPIIGGIITAKFGFQYVSYISVLFFIFAVIALMATPDEHVAVKYSSKVFIKDLKENTPKSLYMSEFGRVFFDGVMWLVWPMFLVFTLADPSRMGLIVGVASGISMIVAVVVGKLLDKESSKNKEGKVLWWGSVRAMVFNVVRGVWHEPIFLTVVDTLNRVNQHSTTVPYDYIFYKWMKSHNSVERSHVRWFIAENVYTIAIGLTAALLFFFQGQEKFVFAVVFAMASLGILMANKITEVSQSRSTKL